MSFSITQEELKLEKCGKGWLVKTPFIAEGYHRSDFVKPFTEIVITPTYHESCIPLDFYTDKCSGPKKTREELNLDHDKYTLCWITHDYNYAYRSTTRAQADEILYNNLRDSGMPESDIAVVKGFLERFGIVAWWRHRILAFFRFKGHS